MCRHNLWTHFVHHTTNSDNQISTMEPSKLSTNANDLCEFIDQLDIDHEEKTKLKNQLLSKPWQFSSAQQLKLFIAKYPAEWFEFIEQHSSFGVHMQIEAALQKGNGKVIVHAFYFLTCSFSYCSRV